MARWHIDLRKPQSEIVREDFPKPPGYSDNLDTVRPLFLLSRAANIV